MSKHRHSMVLGSRALLAGLALGALGVACGGAPDGQGTPSRRSSASDLTVHPMDLGPFDILGDVKEIYSDYQWLQQVDSAAPPPDQQILSNLAQLQSEMTTLSGQLQTLEAQIAGLVQITQQQYVLSTEQQVAEQLGLAKTAIDEVNEWVQMGRTGPQIGYALDNSLVAINTLSSTPFWYMPDAKNPGSTVFDPRMALVAYLASLTARVGVLTLYDPSFRSITQYTDEFAAQLQWMNQLESLMNQRVSCWDGFQADSGPTQWGICSQCTDPNTQYLSQIDGMASQPNSPSCIPPFGGTQANAQTYMSYVNFYDRYRVLDEMGLHAVQAFLPGIQLDATPPPIFPIPFPLHPPPYGPGAWNDPGILNQGFYCLEAAPQGWYWNGSSTVYGNGLIINWCSNGADQVWTTPGYGESAGTLWAVNGNEVGNVSTPPTGVCVEVSGWLPPPGWEYGSPYSEGCSGSPGEQWRITQDGHIVWAKNPSYCLATPSGNPIGQSPVLAPCASTPSQVWSRAVPHIVPIKL